MAESAVMREMVGAGDQALDERASSISHRRSPRRLALVIANLGWGGAQKVMVTMANHWAAMGWQITLVSIDEELDECYFPPHPAVRVRYLGLSAPSRNPARALLHNARRLVVLRRAIRESGAEAVISFLSATNVLTLLATRGLRLPVIVSERGDPDRSSLSRAWQRLRSVTYPFAFGLVAQTDAALARFGPRTRRRGRVIPNPVPPPPHQPAGDGFDIVAAGHLLPVKGFDVLIAAFAAAARQRPDWRLTIWGDGPDRDALLDLARRLGVADRVRLPGRSTTPGGWLERAAIFVLSSRHEGFPNALAEAMAAGLPVAAADCPVGGPRAMITPGHDGLLVPKEDPAALAEALGQLMDDPLLRHRLGEAAARSARRYSADEVMARWTGLVEEAIAA